MGKALNLSPQQQAAKAWVSSNTDNRIVKAVAGAGKTTDLIEVLKERGVNYTQVVTGTECYPEYTSTK